MLKVIARILLTDSGGMQKEAFFFGVPCVTLRPETELVETVEAWWNVVVGSERSSIVQKALNMQPIGFCRPLKAPHPEGDHVKQG